MSIDLFSSTNLLFVDRSYRQTYQNFQKRSLLIVKNNYLRKKRQAFLCVDLLHNYLKSKIKFLISLSVSNS